MGSLVAELAEKLSSSAGSMVVDGTITLKEQADAESDTAAYGQIWVNTATPNELYFTTDAGDDIQITSGTALSGAFDTDAAQVFNESGGDNDFRIEGDAQTHLFFLDASTDRIGINTSSPAVGLDIRTPVNVGLDGTGHDVIFYGDTAGRNVTWDQSDDALEFTDSAELRIGTGNDMVLYHDGSNSYINNAVGALKLATATSGIAVTIGHTTSETTVADNLTVTGELISTLGAGNSTVTRVGQTCRMFLGASMTGQTTETYINNWDADFNDDSSIFTPTTSGAVEGIKVLRAATYLCCWSNYIAQQSTNGYLESYLSLGGNSAITDTYNIQYVVGANTWTKNVNAHILEIAQNSIIGQYNSIQSGTYTIEAGTGRTFISITYLHD